MAQTSRTLAAGGKMNSPSVELLVPVGMPLDIVDLDYTFDHGVFKSNSYTVANKSQNALVALITAWTFSGGDTAHPQVRTVYKVVDSWETAGAFLQAHGSDKIESLFDISGPPLNKVSVAITYAEFENGDRLGASPDCTYANLFVPRRTTILNSYKKVLDKYNSGASPEELDIFVMKQAELTWLNLARSQNGFEFMMDQIRRPRQLGTVKRAASSDSFRSSTASVAR